MKLLTFRNVAGQSRAAEWTTADMMQPLAYADGRALDDPAALIATGTPEGVGIGFNPPRFLRRGDVVAIETAGIGRLENDVGAKFGKY